ncbi:hypothetical protein CTAYLR_008933, partial [Chrysophaeum taylorii]
TACRCVESLPDASQQKNHTARNKTVREHAKGIRKVPNFRYKPLKGMDPKFLRNQRYAKKWQKGGRHADEEDKSEEDVEEEEEEEEEDD